MFGIIDQFRDIASSDPKTVFYYSDRRNTVVTNTYLCIAARMLLTDGKVYSLSQNRRCAANILELAKKVISENDLRFDKQLLGIRPGGLVQYVSYNTVAGENIQVLDQLKKMSTDELYETIVCYREKNSSIMLAELLENEGVPYYTDVIDNRLAVNQSLQTKYARFVFEFPDEFRARTDLERETFNGKFLVFQIPIEQREVK